MADDMRRGNRTHGSDPETNPGPGNELVPEANDPGGAHGKGYSADPEPEAALNEDGPVPLAPGPQHHPAVRQPERQGKVRPTGRSEPKPYTPNDRLTGADR
jgi:hypothetical protein